MGVDHDALRVAELCGHDVRRLAGDAREPQELLDPAGHLPVELLEQHAHRAAQRLRLLPVEAGGEDVSLELLRRHGQVVLGLPVLDEQPLGHAVDVHVGRLGGQHHGDEQLEVVREPKRDGGVGVLGGEALDDRADALSLRADAPARLGDVATSHARRRAPSARSPRHAVSARSGTSP